MARHKQKLLSQRIEEDLHQEKGARTQDPRVCLDQGKNSFAFIIIRRDLIKDYLIRKREGQAKNGGKAEPNENTTGTIEGDLVIFEYNESCFCITCQGYRLFD